MSENAELVWAITCLGVTAALVVVKHSRRPVVKACSWLAVAGGLCGLALINPSGWVWAALNWLVAAMATGAAVMHFDRALRRRS